MKSVMINIQPKWCELIASDIKTVEVRKTRPKIDTPFKCYIYCTQGKDVLAISRYSDNSAFLWKKSDVDRYNIDMVRNGKVMGEFVCNNIDNHTLSNLVVKEDAEHTLNGTCLTREEVLNYLGYQKGTSIFACKNYGFYGWHISDLVIYDKPKELSKYRTLCKGQYKDCRKCGNLLSEGCESTGFF